MNFPWEDEPAIWAAYCSYRGKHTVACEREYKNMAGQNRNTIGSEVAGIPCLIEITEYRVCPAEPDVGIFYPYEEIEYLVRDRKGYLAPWLERKITDEDIEQQIIDYMQP